MELFSFGWVFLIVLVAAAIAHTTRSKNRESSQTNTVPPNAQSRTRRKRKKSSKKRGVNTTRDTRVHHVPNKFTITIHRHSLEIPTGRVNCWTFVSHGLWSLGQKEIVFTIQRKQDDADDDYPTDLLSLYSSIYQFAAQGRIVDVGDYTILSPTTPLLGQNGYSGVLYTPPQLLEGVHISAPWLMGILVTENEAAVAQHQGVARVMAMLGQNFRYYPVPPWLDRNRKEITSPALTAVSIVPKLPRIALKNVSACLEQDSKGSILPLNNPDLIDMVADITPKRVRLHLRDGAVDKLREWLSTVQTDCPFAILVGPDPSAHTCLVWEPQYTRLSAIRSPCGTGQVVAGNFIGFLPNTTESMVRIVEDGFLVQVRDDTWEQLRNALMTGKEFTLECNGDTSFEVRLAPTLDLDFVDPNDSHLPAGWHVFHDDPPNAITCTGAFEVRNVILLTLQHIVARRVETKALAGFIDKVRSVSATHFANAVDGPGHDMTIVCEVCSDGSSRFQVEFRPQIAEFAAAALEKELLEISPPAVVAGLIRFQLNCQLRGGAQTMTVARPSSVPVSALN